MQYTNIICTVKVEGLYQIIPDEGEDIKQMLLGFARVAYKLLEQSYYTARDTAGVHDKKKRIEESGLETFIRSSLSGTPERLDMDFRDYGIVVKVTRLGDGNWYFNSSLFERYFPGNEDMDSERFLELVEKKTSPI